MALVNDQALYVKLDEMPASATDSAVEVWRRGTPATSAVGNGGVFALLRTRSATAG